jgi:hypothetical protein
VTEITSASTTSRSNEKINKLTPGNPIGRGGLEPTKVAGFETHVARHMKYCIRKRYGNAMIKKEAAGVAHFQHCFGG